MVIVRIWGGIGNQLFQYVFGQFIKYKYEQDVFYDDNSFGCVDQLRQLELDFLQEEINYCRKFSFSKRRGIINRLCRLVYKLNPKNHFIPEGASIPCSYLKGHTYYFQGYWQNIEFYQWLLTNVSDFKIKSRFQPKELEKYWTQISDKNHQSISVHIRRGDYFSPKNIGIYGVCDADYFHKAITIIEDSIDNPYFYIFTDDPDWVNENINIQSNYEIIRNYEIPQFAYIELMSRCKHNIISNSSFSWWGSVLNANEKSIVICPSKWTLNSEKTIALTNWLKI